MSWLFCCNAIEMRHHVCETKEEAPSRLQSASVSQNIVCRLNLSKTLVSHNKWLGEKRFIRLLHLSLFTIKNNNARARVATCAAHFRTMGAVALKSAFWSDSCRRRPLSSLTLLCSFVDLNIFESGRIICKTKLFQELCRHADATATDSGLPESKFLVIWQ